MRNRGIFGVMLFLVIISTSSMLWADAVEDLAGILRNRTGSASFDGREDDRSFGIKTGCHGDTFSASVTITGVSGKLEGETAVMSVTYSGQYTRQGWGGPCVQTGHEDRNISGKYSFRITNKKYQRPIITWGESSDIGEVPDPGHDSNRFAIMAVQNAINGAF